MKLVELTNLKSSSLTSKTISPRSKQNAQKSFYNSGKLAFIVEGVNRFAGRQGDRLRVLVTRVDGSRYMIALWDGINLAKKDGTVSTAAVGSPTTAAAIVTKINSSNLGEFIRATLYTDCTNIDFTGTSTVNFADSFFLRGGRN